MEREIYNDQYVEAKEMVKFILKGHNETETADEFCTSKDTVRRRLKSIGYTYADLKELADKRSKRQGR